MKKAKKKGLRVLLCGILALLMVMSCGCSEIVNVEPAPQEPETPPVYDGPVGYVAAAPSGTGFVACGTGGRVDYIDIEGNVEQRETGTTANMNDVFAEGDHVAVCGDYGTLLISSDGGVTFQKVELDTKENLAAVAVFGGSVFVAGEKGVIYRENGSGWEAVEMAEGIDMIDLVATEYCLAAITADTHVYLSTDGENWAHQNFNEYYDGLYPPYVFTRAVPAGETLFVLGYHRDDPNVPLIMYTVEGDVWMQKNIVHINGEPLTGEEELRIHDISFNIDQIVGVMDDGQVLAITECITCNELKVFEGADDLWATAVQEDGVLICGENFYASVLKSSQIRQDKIGAEQAKLDVDFYGAVLIDVREEDELAADGYIPGSIHLPVGQVKEKLRELVPDINTEIIFYCASGKRSQTATEQAVEMGYYKVYNLGGLSDWPYEIVKD